MFRNASESFEALDPYPESYCVEEWRSSRRSQRFVNDSDADEIRLFKALVLALRWLIVRSE